MVREIVTDENFLRIASVPADRKDISAAKDLLDTLKANADRCVGMAANMIGISKRIIAFSAGKTYFVMLNPEMTAHSAEEYEAEEGCLSLKGTRKTTRFKTVTVEYLDMKLRRQKQSFSGFTAQIIQHELDHLEGKII